VKKPRQAKEIEAVDFFRNIFFRTQQRIHFHIQRGQPTQIHLVVSRHS